MTELEFLKQESGLTDEELKGYEALLGDAKFKTMLTKLQASKETAATQLSTAEQERLNLENQWKNVYQPELLKVTQDSLNATGEAARLRAELEQARKYGIVPPADTAAAADPAPRAPGSPDTSQFATKADFEQLRGATAAAVTTLSDLSAEHYKLFGTPLPNAQELVDEVTRERTLGRAGDPRAVWERKYNVAAKRAELSAAEQKKHDDEVAANAIKAHVEAHGENPSLRIGTRSRFSTYDPTKAGDATKPWQRPPGLARSSNAPWRQDSATKIATSVKQ